MDSRQQTPESQPTEAQQTGESQKGFQSWSESMILPRASLFDRPPTPPPKDPPKDTQLRTPTVPVEGTKQTNESSGPGESKRILQGDKVQQQAVSKPVDVDLRQSTAIWGKNKIATTGSTLGGKEKGGKQIPTFRIHPLAMSPPSPAPSAVTKMPRRPARPASLRLSSFSSRIGLTMDNIVRVDTSRPGTSRSQVSKLHTGVTNTTRGTRIKHGHGKYATTELVPQPSDDPEDPLVRESLSISHRYRCSRVSRKDHVRTDFSHLELANMEERTELLLHTHDCCHGKRDEDHLDQREC